MLLGLSSPHLEWGETLNWHFRLGCLLASRCLRKTREQNFTSAGGAPPAALVGKLTSFPLLQRKLMPVVLHPIPQCHPQLRLFLRRHDLPPLLNARQHRIRNRVSRGSPMTFLLLQGSKAGYPGKRRIGKGGRGMTLLLLLLILSLKGTQRYSGLDRSPERGAYREPPEEGAGAGRSSG